MESIELQPILDFALDAVWQAGKITQHYYQADFELERKGDDSPVTNADREAERLLRGLIEAAYPDDGIIGEELGAVESRSGRTWTIDPIDGTKSFICGVPFYSNLVALLDENGRALVGVANFPALNEVVYAARGIGCFLNGRRVRVNNVSVMRDAVFLASEMSAFRGCDAIIGELAEATYIQRTWGDAYGYAMVATGRAAIMIDAHMQVWDCAPLQVILEEAGGTFSDWNGNPTVHAGESVATNGALFNDVIAITRTKY